VLDARLAIVPRCYRLQLTLSNAELTPVILCAGECRGLPWADQLNRRGSGVRGAVLVSHAQRILTVTSAYHTRRALAIFRHRLPRHEWSVAAAPDESAYGADWWRRRAWAKSWWSEVQRFAWWGWWIGGAMGRLRDVDTLTESPAVCTFRTVVERVGKEFCYQRTLDVRCGRRRR